MDKQLKAIQQRVENSIKEVDEGDKKLKLTVKEVEVIDNRVYDLAEKLDKVETVAMEIH